MGCKEAFPIVTAVIKYRQLLQGDLPFVSVNDHQSLKYVFAGPLRAGEVGKPAQGRLARWATLLRSFVFEVRHIPGAENMFCDLLSRNGCTTAILLHARLHDHTANLRHNAIVSPPPAAGKQYAIIMPAGVPPKNPTRARRSRDVDVHTNPLLPKQDMLQVTAPRIADAQVDANIRATTFVEVGGTTLFTNASGKVIIPAPRVRRTRWGPRPTHSDRPPRSHAPPQQ